MKIKLLSLFTIIVFSALLSRPSFAGSNDDCLACHSDSTMTR